MLNYFLIFRMKGLFILVLSDNFLEFFWVGLDAVRVGFQTVRVWQSEPIRPYDLVCWIPIKFVCFLTFCQEMRWLSLRLEANVFAHANYEYYTLGSTYFKPIATAKQLPNGEDIFFKLSPLTSQRIRNMANNFGKCSKTIHIRALSRINVKLCCQLDIYNLGASL